MAVLITMAGWTDPCRLDIPPRLPTPSADPHPGDVAGCLTGMGSGIKWTPPPALLAKWGPQAKVKGGGWGNLPGGPACRCIKGPS